MLSLPKVKKGIKRAVTRLETAKKAIAGAALALGVTLAGLPVTEAHAAPTAQAPSQMVSEFGGSLLLEPTVQIKGATAYHYSHYSHSSHSSHSSHYSHYSSR